MANEVKWIKVTTDIFDPDGKLFAIETMPDGHMIELFWFKTLVLTGKLNMCGFLVNSAKYPYTDEMLAKAFNMEIGTVQRSIEVLQQMNMIEVVDNAYMVSNWLSYQQADSLEEIRGKNAKRQREFRERQKLKMIEEKEKNDSNVTVTLQDNVTSSISISNINNISSFSKDIENIIDYLNIKTNKRYTYNNKSFNRLINARLKDGYTVDDFKTVIDKKCNSWIGTEMEQYLKPTTLFAPSHFEEYLNETVVDKKKPKSVEEQTEDYIDRWRNV